jgi:hypothetical protein
LTISYRRTQFRVTIVDMNSSDDIRPLTDVPDHGFGLLGGLAHSVLAEYVGTALSAPRVHLGQNTLPNPPLPLATQVPFGDLTEGWRECGEDLFRFLETGARTLRTQPTPDISVYSQQVRILQRVLRFDSIAMVWQEQMGQPANSGANRSSRSERESSSDPAPGAPVVIAVDRAGTALLGWINTAKRGTNIEIAGGITADNPIIARLQDVLLAQYDWISAVFGVVP